jgi:Short C-terminal domain
MRRGPGLVGTVARTAVVAGTATVAVKGVSGAMNKGDKQTAPAQPTPEQTEMAQKAAAYDDLQQQQQIDDAAAAAVAAQTAAQAAAPPPPPPAPAAAAGDDPVAQLQKLADMKAQGLITDEEFAAMKAKIVSG